MTIEATVREYCRQLPQLGEVHVEAALIVALEAGSADVGIRVADDMAEKLTIIRSRFPLRR